MEPSQTFMADRVGVLTPVAPDELGWDGSITEQIVAVLRTAVARSLTSWGIPRDPLNDVVLVVAELCTNVLRYAPEPRVCALRVRCLTQAVQVAVQDEGHVIPPLPKELPHWTAIRGRGLYMLRQTCQDVHWEQVPGGKRIVALVAA